VEHVVSYNIDCFLVLIFVRILFWMNTFARWYFLSLR